MLKKTISYIDYDGNPRTEDFYFNLDTSELTKMTLSPEGGLDKVLKKMVSEQNMKKLIEMFDKLLLASYGEKSLDGKYFDKSEEISRRFKNSRAYDKLFMELFGDTNKAIEFLKNVLPSNLSEQVDELIKKNGGVDALAKSNLTVVS